MGCDLKAKKVSIDVEMADAIAFAEHRLVTYENKDLCAKQPL